jgi:predicted ATPase/DNA-binding XRE family transcriptional regulator
MVEAPLSDLLRTYRTDARLSQEALAERAGVSARTIGDIETGIARFPRAITISLLAEALGLEPRERDGLRGAARRRESATAPPRGVPAAPPPLIGRDAELAELGRLSGGATRIVTITGGAGVGKTALALRFAHEAAERFGGNPIVVELVGVPDATLVPTKVALAAGVREAGGESVAASIAAAIGDRPALFVLDNFEHVVAAAPFVAALTAAAPALQVIVTSRVPLRIAGERTFPLASLSPGDATRLFVERVRRDAPEFSVSEDEAQRVASIVGTLDGIPLAIELAAPLLRTVSAAELARRLAHPLDVLVGEPAAPAGRRTMRDAIAWSYELLAPQQRVTMRRLGIFTGRFGLEAAQRVISDAPVADALATLRALAALADHNLVRVVEYGEEEPRFEVPALVRDYLAELLAAGGEAEGLRERLAEYCAQLVAGDGPLRAIDGDVAMNVRLDLESPNLDAILDWARATKRIAFGLRLAVRLRQFWWLRGAYAQGYVWLSTMLTLADGAERIDDALLAAAHASAAGLAQAMARFDLSAGHIDRALPILRASNDRPAMASLLSGLALGRTHAGDYAGGRALLREGLAIRRELGEPVAIARSLCDLGSNFSSDGDYAAAGTCFEEALQAFRGAGNDVGISATLANFAMLALRTEMPGRAESFASEGLRIAERAGFDDGVRVTRYLLARATLARGDDEGAESHLRGAIRAGDDGSANMPASDALQLWAAIEHARGDNVAAARILGAASLAPTGGDVAQVDARRAARLERAVRDALGPAFEDHWSAGRAGGFRRALAEVHPPG